MVWTQNHYQNPKIPHRKKETYPEVQNYWGQQTIFSKFETEAKVHKPNVTNQPTYLTNQLNYRPDTQFFRQAYALLQLAFASWSKVDECAVGMMTSLNIKPKMELIQRTITIRNHSKQNQSQPASVKRERDWLKPV